MHEHDYEKLGPNLLGDPGFDIQDGTWTLTGDWVYATSSARISGVFESIAGDLSQTIAGLIEGKTYALIVKMYMKTGNEAGLNISLGGGDVTNINTFVSSSKESRYELVAGGVNQDLLFSVPNQAVSVGSVEISNSGLYLPTRVPFPGSNDGPSPRVQMENRPEYRQKVEPNKYLEKVVGKKRILGPNLPTPFERPEQL